MTRRAATPEAPVVKACLHLLRLRGLLAWRSNNVPVYDPVRKRYRAFAGLKGVSDILAVVPVQVVEPDVSDEGCRLRTYGVLCAIECKAPRGRLSPEQKWFLDRVREAGGLAFCVKSVAELDAALRAEGVYGP